MDYNNDDRRKYKRFPAELSARYVKEANEEWRGCTSTNISRGGMGIIVYLQENVPVDSSLQLEIIFPAKEVPIKASGILRWIEQQGKEMNYMGGVEFTKIDPEDKWALLDYAYDKWSGKEEE